MYNMMMPRRRQDGRKELDFFGNRFLSEVLDAYSPMNPRAFRVDVKETHDAYEMTAELPGMKDDQIDITVQDGIMMISANMNRESKEERDGYVYTERHSGNFRRTFNLEGINEDAIAAKYEDGLLKLTLPKTTITEKAAPVRKIAIEGLDKAQDEGDNKSE